MRNIHNNALVIPDTLALIWDHISEPILVWQCRNIILYKPINHTVTAEMAQMIERLLWYSKYQHEVLGYQQCFLIDYDSDSLQRMSYAWQQARLTLLDVGVGNALADAKKAHKQNVRRIKTWGLGDSL